jgi:hypothetical protein
MWSPIDGRTVAAHVSVPKVVGDDQDDIRLGVSGPQRDGQQLKQQGNAADRGLGHRFTTFELELTGTSLRQSYADWSTLLAAASYQLPAASC